ncbi:MAG: DUF488 domain-containing protein [Phycisphaerales bacterium]
MPIRIKRVYDDPAPSDGFRVLVDRLWPRGLTKEAAALDRWDKDVAPSADLRKRFHANPEDWGEFKRAYVKELRANKAAVGALLDAAKASRKKTLTLLYASRDETQNHAVVLRDFLNAR